MGLLKRHIPGSSIIEAIVASLIFLTVFVISLSTMTGFSLREDEGYVLLEAERQLTACFERYGNGAWPEGTCTDTFDWGRITTTISRYGDYPHILQVALRAELKGSRKTLEYRRLITAYDE